MSSWCIKCVTKDLVLVLVLVLAWLWSWSWCWSWSWSWSLSWSWFVLSCLILSCLVLTYLILYCLVLPCVLSCRVLSYFLSGLSSSSVEDIIRSEVASCSIFICCNLGFEIQSRCFLSGFSVVLKFLRPMKTRKTTFCSGKSRQRHLDYS